MEKGKRICRQLRKIRRQIARENDIALVTTECRHKGSCLGTCPKCEAEIRYLEEQGIPYVAYNCTVPREKVLAYVGCSYEKAGRIAAGKEGQS